MERSFAWTTRFRRLVRDDERLPQTLPGLHLVALAPPCSTASQWLMVRNSLLKAGSGGLFVVFGEPNSGEDA